MSTKQVTFGLEEGYGVRGASAEIHKARGEVDVYAIASYKFGTGKVQSAPLLTRLGEEADRLASRLGAAMSMGRADAKDKLRGVQRLKVYEPRSDAAAVIVQDGAPAIRVSGMFLWKGDGDGQPLVDSLKKVLGKEFAGVKVKEF